MAGRTEEGPILLYERRGRVALITLNRPTRMNALSPELMVAIQEAIARANSENEVATTFNRLIK